MQIFKTWCTHYLWPETQPIESDGPRHCLATVNIPKVMLSLHADKAQLMSHRLCHCSANINIQKVMLCRQSTVDKISHCHYSAIANIQEVMLLLHANWTTDDESHESDGPHHCLAAVNIPKVMLPLHADKAQLMSHRLCHCSAKINTQKVMLCQQSTVDNNRLCHCSAKINIQKMMLTPQHADEA